MRIFYWRVWLIGDSVRRWENRRWGKGISIFETEKIFCMASIDRRLSTGSKDKITFIDLKIYVLELFLK